ncbi:hypothetical protein [Niabella ginsengisoli]|uniref:Uncharacterized protein n=1 Tax=Niabella ginsengisoli TaxID=522298 RepID=A0ABS9SLC3_9BACT|nr:hypothetical protein [Niabella ginsengisoli]MCH5599189.1 hypothetical protein [Niabella ginsengisoli]
MKYFFLILIAFVQLLQTGCSQKKDENKSSLTDHHTEMIPEEKDYQKINNNLDNYTIRNSEEDLENFRLKKPVYSIKYYKIEDSKNNPKEVKKINGKDFYLQSYTEYLKDGRKRYKEYIYDHIKRIENFHYDEHFANLILLHRIEPNPENERNYYNILNYHPNKILKEDIYYRTYKGTDFDFEGFATYDFQKIKDSIVIKVKEIGYDTIPDPEDIYTFIDTMLIKTKPLYQSKKQYFKWIASKYHPFKTEGYVFDDRDVDYEYDEKGFIKSETWIKNGALENKTEYEYNEDYTERIEQDYHMRGTEKSTKHIKKYNKHGDLISEQIIEYTGNQLNPYVYEYVYDENDNWIEKKKFSINLKEENKKELLQHEIREIIYFGNDSKIRELKLPQFSKKIDEVRADIPKLAQQKQQSINEFNEAVEAGNYDSKITKTEATSLEDFTPKFWKLKQTALGDLDNQPGDEAAIVYETPVPGDLGFAQALAIFKKTENKWKLWHQSFSPVLGTQNGGMMGNPFESISISNRTIIIHHFGGSRQKWNYTHIYRYQNNDWYLIGAGVHFGAPCDYFVGLDYNLSTGNIVADYAQEICDDENPDERALKEWKETFKRKIPLPKMDMFTPGDNRVEIPNQDYEMYY